MSEFVMLAESYDEQPVGGWWLSEKLDGQRAFWDGGCSRGKLCKDVPYANVLKDSRLLIEPIATGLWSRYGKVIRAPDWWLDELPVGVLLDMELWAGRGMFQTLRSIVGSFSGFGWENVKGYAIDSPSWAAWGRSTQLAACSTTYAGLGLPDEMYPRLTKLLSNCESVKCLEQMKLPLHPSDARKVVETELKRVVAEGGEGLMLRRNRAWVPRRSKDVLKVKEVKVGTGIVEGWTPGKGKFRGMIGALKIGWTTKFELSGMTDAERFIGYFNVGDTVSFNYRELTDAGKPKEARFLARILCKS